MSVCVLVTIFLVSAHKLSLSRLVPLSFHVIIIYDSSSMKFKLCKRLVEISVMYVMYFLEEIVLEYFS